MGNEDRIADVLLGTNLGKSLCQRFRHQPHSLFTPFPGSWPRLSGQARISPVKVQKF